jgi:hypothetical protein
MAIMESVHQHKGICQYLEWNAGDLSDRLSMRMAIGRAGPPERVTQRTKRRIVTGIFHISKV